MNTTALPPYRLTAIGLVLLVALTQVGSAQDPVDQGVRLGITYTPGMRPGMLVLGGPHRELLDSVRSILQRDLEYSDRFEMIYLPSGDSLVLGVSTGASSAGGDTSAEAEPYVNYSLYAALGADYAVSVLQEPDSVLSVNLYDVRGELVRARAWITVRDVRTPGFRMAVHRAADEAVRGATGEAGFAASRIAFVSGGRAYVIDSDGADQRLASPSGVEAFSPAWDPTGRRLAYTELREDGWGSIVIHDTRTDARSVIGPTREYLNYGPEFSPDGQTLAFSRAWEEGTDIFAYNLARDCCLQRLTVGRLSDNLSPSFSPDGRRIAFSSTRVGLSQIYVMAADGTDQELFAPYDYGVTGDSHSPSWSPDGLNIAFHRTVAGSPQLFVMDVRGRAVRQLTSAGRNEDPSWAPDGRHLVFKSSRTGAEQLWVIDSDTGRVRQLTRIGRARLPDWSTRIAEPIEP